MICAIYVDFDGCLSDELPGVFMDLEIIQYIRNMNDKAQKDDAIPFIAINSGRPQPFIEAHAQTMGINHFSVFENGVGIFRFRSSEMEMVIEPKITHDMILGFNDLTEKISKRFKVEKQPGKEYSLTFLLPKNHPKLIEIEKYGMEIITENNLPLYIERGLNFINININGITKGTGLRLAAINEGLNLDEIAMIGDSGGDWNAMKLSGFSACPNNAREQIKKKVDYVSPYNLSKGTIDIIEQILEKNK
ncbi:MAG: HAD hydrolase family protein [Candidatus Lokiarchaeota archaeon]|nr:HAD hydrolase family protein [Candidatus Lokiarchaeota archaeon]